MNQFFSCYLIVISQFNGRLIFIVIPMINKTMEIFDFSKYMLLCFVHLHKHDSNILYKGVFMAVHYGS